jgi:hypothetical protein
MHRAFSNPRRLSISARPVTHHLPSSHDRHSHKTDSFLNFLHKPLLLGIFLACSASYVSKLEDFWCFPCPALARSYVSALHQFYQVRSTRRRRDGFSYAVFDFSSFRSPSIDSPLRLLPELQIKFYRIMIVRREHHSQMNKKAIQRSDACACVIQRGVCQTLAFEWREPFSKHYRHIG